MRVVSQNVAGILADNQYYKTPALQQELKLLGQDVQAMARDTSYEETRDSYHHHFWKADVESEDKCKSFLLVSFHFPFFSRKCKFQKLVHFGHVILKVLSLKSGD